MDGFFLNIVSLVDPQYSIVIEDDGRVAYAYLMKFQEIVGDVWLYNRRQQQDTLWNKNEMPLINPVEYVKEELVIEPLVDEKDVNVVWGHSNNVIIAKVFFYNQLVAILAESVKPGWSALVKKSGPLAQVLPPVF